MLLFLPIILFLLFLQIVPIILSKKIFLQNLMIIVLQRYWQRNIIFKGMPLLVWNECSNQQKKIFSTGADNG